MNDLVKTDDDFFNLNYGKLFVWSHFEERDATCKEIWDILEKYMVNERISFLKASQILINNNKDKLFYFLQKRIFLSCCRHPTKLKEYIRILYHIISCNQSYKNYSHARRLATDQKSYIDINNSYSFLVTNENNSSITALGYRSSLISLGFRSFLTATESDSQLLALGNFARLVTTNDYSSLIALGNHSILNASGDNSNLIALGKQSNISSTGNSLNIKALGKKSRVNSLGIKNVVTLGEKVTAVLSYINKKNQLRSIEICEGENGIKSGVPYKLDENGVVIEAEDIINA